MPTILIVDDEPDNSRALKRYLSDKHPDWSVVTAQSEGEAETVLGNSQVDVVITDLVMMSDRSGMEVLRSALRIDPLVMPILITAYEKKLDRYRAFELGAFDCVQKNTPGVIAAEEILVKTQAALRFRELAIAQLKNEQRVAFLKRYFDPKVFAAIEDHPDLLELRRQVVSIVFWDIRGFSALSEILKAHPTLISAFLREYFQAASETIFANGGILDKFIGDGVMALFGALETNMDEGRDSAITAVRAALSLRAQFQTILQRWLERWALYTPQAISIGLGCGIHTGEALVGIVGTEARDQYTALGPHVNFAARLEARSDKGQVLVSASTETRVRDRFVMEQVGIIDNVKNIPGEFRIYQILAEAGTLG